MEKLNHLKVTLVFIVTIIIPSLFLSAFAYQAVEGERVARHAELKRRLQDDARGLARDIDEGVRAPAREKRDACARLRGRIKRPQDAAPLLQGLVDAAATTLVAIFAPDGRRAYPAARAAVADHAAVGTATRSTSADAAALLRDAAAAARGDEQERAHAIETLHRLERDAPPATAIAATLEEARLLAIPNDEETFALAEKRLARVTSAPLDLIDPLGRPVVALARFDWALMAANLRQRVVYRERLRALLSDLERDAALLPVEDVTDLGTRIGARLLAEGKPWDEEAPRAAELVLARQRIDEWHERLGDLFGKEIKAALRSHEKNHARGDQPPAGGAGGGDPLAGRPPAAQPGPEIPFLRRFTGERREVLLLSPVERQDGSLVGLAAFPLDLDSFARKVLAERASEDGTIFELAQSPPADDDPGRASAVLGYPLDGLIVVARARALPADVLEAERGTIKLWLIALSVGGIAAGALVTTRTVVRETKAAELKSDFVTNVTHELRTPLTSIRMFIETLQLGRVEDEEESRECLGIMARETERLTRLIERLLAFSKIESRKWRFKFFYVPPRELVEEAIRVLRQQLGLMEGTPLPISIESIQECTPVAVDKDAIVEVLLNLLTNAWKYTPAEGRQLRVVLTERRRQVVIDVEDNGIGVPRRDRRRIWKKFERGSNAEKARVEGSGIGLTLALSIAKGHGGTIALTPLKQGSRFSLILPKV